jgi:uncharacterized protein YqgC (DUF456 family)
VPSLNLDATVLCGILVAVGIVGVIIPHVPGLLLSWFGVALWTFIGGAGPTKWIFFAIATVIALAGFAIKFALPGRNLRASGVHTLSIVVGGIFGIVGFFLLPVIGLPLGFVLGVLLMEWMRYRDIGHAWEATKVAVKAVGLAVMIEVAAAFTVAVVWVLAVFLA